jgi:sulfide:quinone oxidoreductase
VERTLVLGAGFGGIAVATTLRDLLGDRHEVLLVDRREHFMMGLRKLWALVGAGSLEDGRRSRTRLDGRGVRFLQREILAIDPAARRVATDAGDLEGDRLVVALGAEPRPDLIPGLAEHAHDVYDVTAIPALAEAVAAIEHAHILILIAGAPYRCPPAPYECAFLLDEHLRVRGIRQRCRITVSTFQPILLPNAGKTGSEWLARQLAQRDIGFHVGRKVASVESGRVNFESGEPLTADLIIGVPPHRPPKVVKESGLTGDKDWIDVDPGTMHSAFERVYAIGDATQITLANGLPLPKAGLFAELEGELVARAIAAEVEGATSPAPFDGRGYCFIELGGDSAALVEGEFFATPEPRVHIAAVSEANVTKKRTFEAERLARWFGA